MAVHKSNLAEKPSSLCYRTVSSQVHDTARVEWYGPTEHDANSLANGPATPTEKTKLDEAKVFLRDELEDGPMWAKDVLRDANDAGVARPTLYTAKAKLRVSSDKIGTQGWQWSLPEGDDPDPHHNVHNLHNLHNLQSKRTSDPALIKEDIEDTEDTQGAVRHVPEHNLPRHLSADEANERVQRLIDEGMSENDAIAEVLGERL